LTATVLEMDARIAYTMAEAAALLGKSPRTLKRLYLKGKLPAKRLGRDLMVPGDWLAQFTAWSPEDGEAA